MPPIVTKKTEVHILRKDLLDIVSEPPVGEYFPVKITMDQNGGLRFWATIKKPQTEPAPLPAPGDVTP